MDDIKSAYGELKSDWDSIYEKLKASPQTFSQHVPYLSLDQMNEIIQTLDEWISRSRAIQGFAPVFHLARGLAASSLAAAKKSLKAIQAGQDAHFPSFVANINQILPAFHTLLIYGGKDDGREAAEGLILKLSEGISLVNTAQTELKQKADLLAKSEEIANQVKAISAELEKTKTEVSTKASAINDLQVQSEKGAKEIISSQEKMRENEKKTASLNEASSTLQQQLNSQAKILEEIINKAKSQEELIDALLPTGASAGLASSFAARVKNLEWVKWAWAASFFVSVLGILGLVLWFLKAFPSAMESAGQVVMTAEELWRHLLPRLPLTAPLIWLGWFSAIQYGNTVRVQEDYAFKEATSKAFEGYRSHLEHIATVNLEEGRNAMTLLAAATIQILAREPLRIFQGSEKDASPAHSILDRFFGKGKNEKGSSES